jgi:hypothetical protein
MDPTEFEKLLARLMRAEDAGQKAQRAMDKAELLHNHTMDKIHSKHQQEWVAFCEEHDLVSNYDFSDILA